MNTQESLFLAACEPDSLLLAWRQIEAKGKKGGADGQSIEAFAQKHELYLAQLRSDLLSGQYVPEPYLKIRISKKQPGQFREIGLPAIRDKIAQLAVKQVLEPPLESDFLDISYGYRSGKSTAKAIRRVLHILRAEKKQWIVDADINDFFSSVDHQLIMERFRSRFPAEKMMADLIHLWIGMAYVTSSHSWIESTRGLPQGNVLSPLLANFFLHPFDKRMVSARQSLVRYADDFLICCRSKKEAEAQLEAATHFLKHHLHLGLNQEATILHASEGIPFLGLMITPRSVFLPDSRLAEIPAKLKAAISLMGSELHPSGLRHLLSMRAYYSRLIPRHQIEQLDQLLFQVVIEQGTEWLTTKQINLRELTPEIFASLPWFGIAEEERPNRNKLIVQTIKSQFQASKSGSDSKIRKKRKQYEQKAAQARELLVQTHGTFLGKSRQLVTVKKQGKIISSAPLKHLRLITVQTAGLSMSSNLIHACAKNGTRIDFLTPRGARYASLESPRFFSTSMALQQVGAYENGKGASLARQWVLGKIRNQVNLIRYFEKNRTDPQSLTQTTVDELLSKLDQEWKRVTAIKTRKQHIDRLRGSFMAAEGRAASAYWSYFKKLLEDDIHFPGRERQGAKDPVNSCLNYGYGILYGRMHEALRQQRLMPVFSYLHSPGEYNEPTLSYDLIEVFRSQAVDRVIFAAIRKGFTPQVKKDGMLSDITRNSVAEKVLERLGKKEQYRGFRYSLDEIIHAQALEIKRYLSGEEPRYRPYIRKW